ncbi:MAG TPA: hypothetical protein VFV47_01855 [Hyphomicrobiaceae bacterium]|nr:hypothetical protein [Hyphomicrobiaceae bacterium]
MTIGVYRVYMSHTWAAGDAGTRLLRALDDIPGFLYRVDTVEPGSVDSSVPEAERRAAIRVAMTQSHVALFLAGSEATDARLLAEELALARDGFRRRVPVLAVVPPGGTESVPFDADRMLACDAAAVACAIQDLSEEARAEHRRKVDAAEVKRSPSPVSPPPFARAESFDAVDIRPLPIAEIADALNRLRLHKAARGPQSID